MLILGSCMKHSSEEKIILIPVKFDNQVKKIGISKIGSKIQYLPLETKPDFLVGTRCFYCICQNK